MKKFMFIALAMLTLGSQVQIAAEKKEKAKKEKKELKWEWDGTKSNNETIDKYLVTIDSLYNRVLSYRDSINAYELKDTVITVNGVDYIFAYMLNPEGKYVTRGQVNWQCAQALMEGVNLVLDMTNAGLESANAALALPSLGLNAFKFGKYVKGGPAVIAQGVKTIKTIRGTWIKNSQDWKDMKAAALSADEVAKLGIFSDDALKKLNKCFYVKPVTETDPKYTEVRTRQESKSQDELNKEAKQVANWIASTEQTPDDKSKELDDISNDALDKALKG